MSKDTLMCSYTRLFDIWHPNQENELAVDRLSSKLVSISRKCTLSTVITASVLGRCAGYAFDLHRPTVTSSLD